MFNKKFLLIFSFFLLFFINFLFATEKEPFFSLSKQRALIGMGNDSWNFGQSENFDDGLSYSLNTLYQTGPLKVKIDLNSVTNRGYKETSSSDFKNGRYDALQIVSSYALQTPVKDDFYFVLEPEIGFWISGNLGMEEAQNKVHDLLKLNKVYLPYDMDNVFHLFLGSKAFFGYEILETENNVFYGNLGFSAGTALFFEGMHSVNAELGLFNHKTQSKTAYFSVAYNSVYPFSGSKTQYLYTEDIKGFSYEYGLNGGFLNIDYKKWGANSYGFTHVLLDFLSFFREKSFYNEDFSFEYARLKLFDRNYDDNRIVFPFLKNFSAVLKMQCTCGYPYLGPGEEGNTDIRYKRNYSFNSLNIRFKKDFFKENILQFYVQGGLGLSVWNYQFLYNMNPKAEVRKSDAYTDVLPFVTAETGLIFLPDKTLIVENCRYKFLLYVGCNYIFNKGAVDFIYTHDNSKDSSYSFSGFAPYFGYGLHISFDI